jgi:hypothetical protein
MHHLTGRTLEWLCDIFENLGCEERQLVVQPENTNVGLDAFVIRVTSFQSVELAPLKLYHLLDDVSRSKAVSGHEFPLIVWTLVMFYFVIIGHTCDYACVVVRSGSNVVFFFFSVRRIHFLTGKLFVV